MPAVRLPLGCRRMAKKIDISRFTVTEKDGVILLVDHSRTVGLVHDQFLIEFLDKNGLEHRRSFRFEVEAGRRYICLESTCWDVEVLQDFGVSWHDVYAAENKPLVARIEGSDWYLVVSPVIRG